MNEPDDELDLTRFEQLLDAHGADLARFPERERAAAVALLSADARAQRMLAQAAALERGLTSLAEPAPSAALRRAVAEIPLRHPRPELGVATLGWSPLRSTWALLAAAALAVALGALSGAWSSDPDLSPLVEEQIDGGSEGDVEGDALDELEELAFAFELDEELSP